MRLRSLSTLLMALAFIVVGALAPAAARAEIEVNVNHGDVQPLPVAVPAFGGGQVGGDISQVISANLQRSGLFRPLDPNSFIEKGLAFFSEKNFFRRANNKLVTNRLFKKLDLSGNGGLGDVKFRCCF